VCVSPRSQGLGEVVDLLVARGGDLTRTNHSHRTPAEEADEAGHEQLASSMEARMVFGMCVMCVCVCVCTMMV
jgi:hypothetical protein